MKLGILGASGAVGRECLTCIANLGIECDGIVLMGSGRSAGTEIATPLGSRTVQEVSADLFKGLDYAIFSAGGSVSKEWAPIANERGCVVIDNSSAFRYDDDIPLVVPEINGEQAIGASLIANPNCTTAIAAVVVHPLYKKFGVRKMIVSTYQSTSGAGAQGMQELIDQTKAQLNGNDAGCEIFAHPIPFNVIPAIDALQENGYTKEEMKVAWETRKIFGDDSLTISCTAVRVPVLRSHCESIVLETEKLITPETAHAVLASAPGVEVVDDPANGLYPMPLTSNGKHVVEVGRIRQNLVFGDHGIEFFIAGDQLLKGAALNALQILQYLISHSS